MPFSLEERTALLALKGVGPTVVTRLEQMGIDSMDVLGKADVSDILAQASAASGSTCWKNSPQARAAIVSVHGDSGRSADDVRTALKSVHEISHLTVEYRLA